MVAVNRFGGIFLSKKIAVVAGDRRMVSLSIALADLSYEVSTVGLEKAGLCEKINCECSLFDALNNADAVVLPVPVSKDNKNVFAPMSERDISITDVLQCIDEKSLIFVPKIYDIFNQYKLKFINYMEDPILLMQNARLTAEGTVCEMIIRSDRSIKGKNILVIGNGNVGKAVSDILKSLGADVTVSARKPLDFALIENKNMKFIKTEKIGKVVQNFDFIINTVPAPVLGQKELKKVNKDAIIIDLASKPGGTDFKAAQELGLDASLVLGIPGKYMPKTAGRILANTVLRHMGEDIECKI